MRAIPYAGAAALGSLAARTTLVRVALAIVLVTLVLAAAFAVRRPQVDSTPLLPPNAGGIVALDLSASITADTYSRIRETLRQLVGRGGRYGLVVFSNTAYEALPPGTPASALEPLLRYFTLPARVAPGAQPAFPVNPWSDSFTSGTSIASGLDLARSIERASGTHHPGVVLVSDLADDPDDIQRLTAVLTQYRAQDIRLSVIGLNAAPNDTAYFARLVGTADAVIPAGLSPANHDNVATPGTRFPLWLACLTVAVALLLAAHELRSARLRWGDAATEVGG